MKTPSPKADKIRQFREAQAARPAPAANDWNNKAQGTVTGKAKRQKAKAIKIRKSGRGR